MFTTPTILGHLTQADRPAVDAYHAWEAARALEHTGLLAIDPATTPPTIRISQTLQAHIRTATPGPMLGRAAQAAADALLQIWPEHEDRPWQATGLRACAAALQDGAGDRLWEAGGCHRSYRSATAPCDATSARSATGPAPTGLPGSDRASGRPHS